MGRPKRLYPLGKFRLRVPKQLVCSGMAAQMLQKKFMLVSYQKLLPLKSRN